VRKRRAVSSKPSTTAGSADILSAACVATNLEADKMSALPAAAQCFLLTAMQARIFVLATVNEQNFESQIGFHRDRLA